MALKDIKLLYVEDEDVIIEEIEDILKSKVKEIIIAKNGQEGLDKYHQFKPDIIITDINMPIMNGIEMSSKIRDENIDIPIIVISAYNDTEYFIDTIKLNITGYILKPINLKEFLKTLEFSAKRINLEKENKDYKDNLEKKVSEQLEYIKKQNSILEKQSKLAAMGEMMDAIAHQWKQPLNLINMKSQLLMFDFQDGLLNEKSLKEYQNYILEQTKHMTNTLNNFRKFLRPNNNTKKFNIKQSIKDVLSLIKDELIKYNIKTNINVINKVEINAIENEFKHVILNIINNAKDAFVENNIENRTIDIIIDKSYLKIIDNAGGIKEDVIESIFEANYTTKDEEHGSGIGLYMSKQIIEKMSATIKANNVENGVCFTISFT